MPITRQQRGIFGGAKNHPIKDLLFTSREETPMIKTKKASIAIWKISTLHQEWQLSLLLDELEKFDIAGISETRWCRDVDVAFQQNGYTIIHSGREDGIHSQGVALVLSSQYGNDLLSYEDVSPRTVNVRVKTRIGVRNIIQVYAPDLTYPDEQYQDFQDLLQLKISSVQKAEEL